MTTVFWVLPEITSKDNKKRVEKDIHGKSKGGQGSNRIYDHFQMLQDRISGMPWYDIGVKHGVKFKKSCDVCNLALNSNAFLKLSPKEIEILLADRF